MPTQVTFDYGAYDGRPVIDETPQDTESLDYGAYDGVPVVYPQETAPPTGVAPQFMHYARLRRA